ncbi:MAG: transglutaminase family protein [Alphaproteobacteria bacterium]
MEFDAEAYLIETGARADPEIDLFQTVIALASSHYKGRTFERYFRHFEKLSAALKEACAKQAGGNPALKLKILADVMFDQFDYASDADTPNPLQAADMIAVIDQRKGGRDAMAILCAALARDQGWTVEGLSIPAFSALRLVDEGQILLFDPLERCKILNAADIRNALKAMQGKQAELSAAYFEPCGNREMLLRLQNLIKFHLIDLGDYAEALKIVEHMRKIAPQDHRVLLDAGVLYSKTGCDDQAIEALKLYLECDISYADRRDALDLLSFIEGGARL